MKKYIIVSGICIFPLFVLSIVIPLLNVDSLLKTAKINETWYYASLVFMFVSLSIIVATLLQLIPYANKIDRLEQAEMNVHQKELELKVLINQYKNLIVENFKNNDAHEK